MYQWRALYWAVIGALLGVGIIALLSIGVFLWLAAGVLLLMLLAIFRRERWRGAWAVVVGFGAGPALILLYDIIIAPPLCPPSGMILQPGQHYAVCSGPLPQAYYVLAIVFGVIALLGIALPLLGRWLRHRDGRHVAA